MTDKLPPSSRDIECAVLGAVFLNPEPVIKQAIVEGGADLFYFPEHAIMFKEFIIITNICVYSRFINHIAKK